MTLHAGPWLLEKRLGAGGMGEVWAATHRRFGHLGAVKRLTAAGSRPDHTWTDSAYRDFDQEIRAIASLDHPNVVRIFDRGIDAELGPWLAMERAAGPVHQVRVPTSWEALQHVLISVLQALGAAHAAGMLHLDVKPANLLVRDDGTLALADFGIVQLHDARGARRDGRWGTPPYMAPERFTTDSRTLTEATDLYAVGCLAIRLAAGHPPFPSTLGWTEAAHHHREVAPPPLVPRFPVPTGLQTWLDTLLAKSPQARFPTAAAALQALDHLGGTLVSTASAGAAGPSSSPPTQATAATRATAATTTDESPVQDGSTAPVRASHAVHPVRIPEHWPEQAGNTQRLAGLGAGLLGVLHVPFTGRADSKKRLWAHLHDRASLAVTGPPGVGRSRLLEAFARAAGAHAGAFVVRIDGTAPGDPSALFADLTARIDTLEPARRVVTVFDDALATEASITLATRLHEARIPLVLAFDDTRRHRAPAALAALPTLPIDPLDTDTVRSLLANWVGLDRSVVAEVAALCEGDVRLAVQTIHHGLDCGALEPAESGLQAVGPVPIPPAALHTWSDTVALLRASLPADGLLLAAAVGTTVDRALLGRALPDATRADAILQALSDRGLATASEKTWRWAATALRLQILQTADTEARSEAHRAIADALEGDDSTTRWLRGLHHLDAGDLQPAMADLFRAASDRIAQGHMMSSARVLERLQHAMEAADLPADDPYWGELWRAFGILGPTHQGNAATWAYNLRALEAARPHADHPGWRPILRSTLGGLVWHANVMYRPDLGAAFLDEGRALVPEGEPLGAGWWDSRGWHALITGRPARAVYSFEKARDLARATGNAHRMNAADGSLAVALCHAGHPDARSELIRAGDAILAAGFLSATADVAGARGDHFRFAGDLEQARHWYDAMRTAVQEGQARADLLFDVCWALWLRDAGHYDHADRVLEAAGRDLDPMLTSWGALIPIHRLSVDVARGWPLDEERLTRLDTALDTLVQLGLIERDGVTSLQRIAARLPDPPDVDGSDTRVGRIRARITELSDALARGTVDADAPWP